MKLELVSSIKALIGLQTEWLMYVRDPLLGYEMGPC